MTIEGAMAFAFQVGLGNEVKPFPRRVAERRSAEIDRPEGVVRSFQVSSYLVQPQEAVLARNLLSNDERRTSLLDQAEELGPEVPLIS